MWSEGKWLLSASGESRFDDDSSRASGFLFGPTLRYRINDSWHAATAVRMIHFRRSGGGFERMQRYRVEANGTHALGQRIQVRHRSRLEYWRREERADDRRFRFRLLFDWKLSGGIADRLFFGAESFYTFADNRFFQSRITPLVARFPLTDRSRVSISYFIQHFPGRDGDNHVLQSSWQF